jgi:hypothetical protein
MADELTAKCRPALPVVCYGVHTFKVEKIREEKKRALLN